jgi:branched-subunit amino acid aminotransferase/4-amino-4-deoxychorismate lyase
MDSSIVGDPERRPPDDPAIHSASSNRMNAAPRKTICFDLDGTLCTNTFGEYEQAEPLPWAIERVNELAGAGHRIVIFTARGTATGIDWDALTRRQLADWGVSYDDLRFGKPSADVYVDDRAVHTTAWLCGAASDVPGFTNGDGDFPEPTPGHPMSVAEVGRTYACRALDVEQHVRRVVELAAGAGIQPLPAAAAVRGALEHALQAAGAREELVFTTSISARGHAGFLDVPELGMPDVRAACRPLRHVAGGLRPIAAPREDGALAVAAATAGEPYAGWPIGQWEDGTLCDLMGGQLGLVENGQLVLQPTVGPPPVASRWIGELAVEAGIETVVRPVRRGDLEASDEAMVVGLPFCVLPLQALDGEPLWGSDPGPVAGRLLQLWSDRVGVDLAEQIRALAGEATQASFATPAG